MDWDRIEMNWERYRKSVRARWDRISEPEIEAIAGQRVRLSQGIQRAYAVSAGEADRQIAEWMSRHERTDARESPVTSERMEQIQETGSGYSDDETAPESRGAAR